MGAEKIDNRAGIVHMAGVGDDRLNRHIVREHFVVRVEDFTALSTDDLFVNVLLSSEPGVFVVLDQLQVNEPERKRAKERDKSKADNDAPKATGPFHLPACSFFTGWIRSSSGRCSGRVSRTMLRSGIGTNCK